MKDRKVFILLEVTTNAKLSVLRDRGRYILVSPDDGASFTVEQVSANVNRDMLRGQRVRNKPKKA